MGRYSARLERIASYSEAHGYQISDDMSQAVAVTRQDPKAASIMRREMRLHRKQ